MHRTTRKLNMLRVPLILIICSLLVSVFVFPASAVESGACGDGVAWVLNAGTLSITGSGNMTDYKESNLPPWYEFRGQIVRLNIAHGVTSIGNFAFYGCEELTTVSVPNSVKSIGDYAFASCERLAAIQIAGSVSSIGEGAFYNCYDLESIRLPYGLSVLGDQAFYRCESLRSISVPYDVRTMGDSVFAYCKELIRAEIYAIIPELPAWTFYGCEQLSDVYLSESIKNIGNYGFKKCTSLTTVFYTGSDATAKVLESQISQDVVEFSVRGYFSKDEMPESTLAGKTTENSNNTMTHTNTTVFKDDQVQVSYVVEQVYSLSTSQKGSYSANVSVTVDKEQSWEQASESVSKVLADINDTYSSFSDMSSTTVTVYMEKGVNLSGEFLEKLTGKDVDLAVVSAGGSSWKMNCKDMVVNESESGNVGKNYSHTVYEASDDICEQLGTDDCYRLTFEESVEQNAVVLVQLPPQTAVNTNAFLYQVNPDGNCERLQAVAVDNEGYAHLYIASVNTGYDYVIGLDVPGEDTSNVIIPDTLVSSGAISALERLENVEYVHIGRVYSNGVGPGGITWILIGVLVGTTVLVGGIMLVFNKLQLAKKAKTKS